MLINPGKEFATVIKSGKMITIALPYEFVDIVYDDTLEYNPVFVPVSEGNLFYANSGHSTEATA